MTTPLDLDQLQSFCAIADCGSFTEAARRVNKTQSAVSMQIKRLEERLGQPLLTRDGRSVSLTQHGEALYARARKMLRTNAEILDLLLGRRSRGLDPLRRAGRLCGAAAAGDPFELPAHASQDRRRRALPAVRGTARGHEDAAATTSSSSPRAPTRNIGELFRTERMFWVASHGGQALAREPLPIAGGQHCCWKDNAVEVLNRIGRDYRIAYTSSNAIAIASAVLTDLAVGFLPESALQPGMRVIAEDKDLPRLRDAQIALMRASHAYGGIYDALASHIVASMGNLDGKEPLPMAAE